MIYHSFEVETAKKHGLPAAIMLKFLEDAESMAEVHDKRLLWKYEALREVFPYFSDEDLANAYWSLSRVEGIEVGRFIQIRRENG